MLVVFNVGLKPNHVIAGSYFGQCNVTCGGGSVCSSLVPLWCCAGVDFQREAPIPCRRCFDHGCGHFLNGLDSRVAPDLVADVNDGKGEAICAGLAPPVFSNRMEAAPEAVDQWD